MVRAARLESAAGRMSAVLAALDALEAAAALAAQAAAAAAVASARADRLASRQQATLASLGELEKLCLGRDDGSGARASTAGSAGAPARTGRPVPSQPNRHVNPSEQFPGSFLCGSRDETARVEVKRDRLEGPNRRAAAAAAGTRAARCPPARPTPPCTTRDAPPRAASTPTLPPRYEPPNVILIR